MAEFADAIGLSRPTVSRYFNDRNSVRKSTRQIIDRGLQDLDYRPNFHASNLGRRRTKAIGIIVPSIIDPFFSALVSTIEVFAEEQGYLTVLQLSHHDAEMETKALDRLQSLNPAGIAMAPCGFSTNIRAVERTQRHIPMVFMDSRLREDYPYFGTDNAHSVPLMIDYLCRSGTPPAFLTLPPLNVNIVERQQAYVRRMGELGLEPILLNPEPIAVRENFERFGYEQFMELPPEKTRNVSTIMCINDRVALGVLSAAAKLGLKVGKGADCDLRIAGHDNQHFSRFTTPSLTTVAQDAHHIGVRSVKTLLGVEGGEPLDEAGELIKGKLIIRDSA